MDLNANVIERHSDPYGGAYRQIVTARAGDTLISTVLPELIIPVDTVLGIGDAPE